MFTAIKMSSLLKKLKTKWPKKLLIQVSL